MSLLPVGPYWLAFNLFLKMLQKAAGTVLRQKLSANISTTKLFLRTFSAISNCSSDIDLFLYGLEDENAAKAKMMEIEENIRACARADVTCIRSTHAVTIVCEYPQRYP
jgi:hypothetical protein